MSRLATLPPAERSLLPGLIVLVAVIRAALWLLPFAPLRRLLRSPVLGPTVRRRALGRVSPERLAWAVQVASRPVPAVTCLTQALALQFVLTRADRPSCVRIGVARDGRHGFRAHAWVECEGRILLDRREDVARYTVLASLEAV
jgi:hypothetical protein